MSILVPLEIMAVYLINHNASLASLHLLVMCFSEVIFGKRKLMVEQEFKHAFPGAALQPRSSPFSQQV